MKNYFFLTILILAVCILLDTSVFAQCPMCKMAAESNMKEGGSVGKGLNTGILYLLAMPYIAVFTLAYLYRKQKKKIE